MKIATWNVNGIRARYAQVLEFVERERPDVLCLQEIKATPDQVPAELLGLPGYWACWHGGKGYSGVALLVAREKSPDASPVFSHPRFDVETRIATAPVGGTVVATVYVPNGGKDFAAKMHFLGELTAWAGELRAAGTPVVICGDMNVARTDRDVHPKERKPNAIGQRPEERERLEGLIGQGLVDVGRALDPDNDNLFTWWAPWRNLRQRNIGWRLDYVLASEALARTASSCTVQRETGTSDHGPVLAVFAEAGR